MRDFRELRFWELSHELVLEVHRVTRGFPAAEVFGLTRQLRKAAGSVPANIAEGCGRSGKAGDGEFRRFLRIAMGSASELEYHLLLARDLGYLSAVDYSRLEQRVTNVKRMLARFILRLRTEN